MENSRHTDIEMAFQVDDVMYKKNEITVDSEICSVSSEIKGRNSCGPMSVHYITSSLSDNW